MLKGGGISKILLHLNVHKREVRPSYLCVKMEENTTPVLWQHLPGKEDTLEAGSRRLAGHEDEKVPGPEVIVWLQEPILPLL